MRSNSQPEPLNSTASFLPKTILSPSFAYGSQLLTIRYIACSPIFISRPPIQIRCNHVYKLAVVMLPRHH